MPHTISRHLRGCWHAYRQAFSTCCRPLPRNCSTVSSTGGSSRAKCTQRNTQLLTEHQKQKCGPPTCHCLHHRLPLALWYEYFQRRGEARMTKVYEDNIKNKKKHVRVRVHTQTHMRTLLSCTSLHSLHVKYGQLR